MVSMSGNAVAEADVMKISYISKDKMPKGKRDLRSILDNLLKDPSKVAKLEVKSFKEAKALSTALHGSSGIRNNLPEKMAMKTQSEDDALYVWLEKIK